MVDVTEGGTSFDTGVDAAVAILPGRPDFWTYSSLKEIEACPRRYALSRASYPALWEGRGYPDVPALAALFGDVVHAALERIVNALIAAGCVSPQAPVAVDVLRKLGGYTAVIEEALIERLLRLNDNPRLDADRTRRLSRDLRDRIPEARTQVQAYLRRTTYLPVSRDGGSSAEGGGVPETGASFSRRPIGPGAYPEMAVAAEDLRLMGRVDLLKVAEEHADLTDYKTGAEDSSHFDQLHLYALLWDRDSVVNPARRPPRELTAAYPSRDVTTSAPNATELRGIENSVRRRITSAEAELTAEVPRAIPREENCRFCQVRQFCDAYWSSVAPDLANLSDGAWFDYQGVVGPQNGTRSWWMLREPGGPRELLLRTSPKTTALPTGSRIRVLGLRFDDDPEVDAPVAVMTAVSETFVLTAGSA